MLYLAEKLKYVKSEQKSLLVTQTDEVSKIIRGLIKSISE